MTTSYLDAATTGREPPVTGAAAAKSISLPQRIYHTATVLPSRTWDDMA